MFTNRMWRSLLKLYLLFLLSIIMSGCASTSNFWGDPENGLILKYRMSEEDNLNYRLQNSMNQNLEMMGQEIKISTEQEYDFSIKTESIDTENHNLNFLIKDMKLKIKSPQGELNPQLDKIIGKNFNMTVTPSGKELNITGIENLTYDVGQQDERGIAQDFMAFFPNLPEKPIVEGEIWNSVDTLKIDNGNSTMLLTFENENKLSGFEKVLNMECVRVEASVKGKMSGTGEQEGMKLVFEGLYEGKDIWYFAYKKGQLVKMNNEGIMKGQIVGSGARDMVIPMENNIKAQAEQISAK